MNWFKVLPAILALVVLPALIAVLVLQSTLFDGEGKIAETPASEPAQVLAQQPAPRIPGGGVGANALYDAASRSSG